MPWDRQTRGLSQRKQEKPQIKKRKPLNSEGSDGDISIRQLKDGVFLFFKALGRWYKTLNTSSEVIPETPNAMQLGSSSQPIGSMFMSANSLHMGNTKREQTKISTDGSLLTFKNKAATSFDMIGATAGGSINFGIGGRNNSITLTSHINANPFKQADGTVLLSFKSNATPYYVQIEQGILRLKEAGVNPSGADSGYGRLYCKGTDSKPYWMYEDGTEALMINRWQENMSFYFSATTGSRTYFRAADDVDGQNTWSNFDTETGTSVDDTISVDAPNSVSGITIQSACVFKGAHWSGYQSASGSARVAVQIWTGTLPDDEASGTIDTLTLRTTNTLTDNETSFSEATAAISITLAAGDVVIPAFSFISGSGVWYGAVAMKFEGLV